MSNPPIYIYGCLSCKKIYKQHGEGELSLYHNQGAIDWSVEDNIIAKRFE